MRDIRRVFSGAHIKTTVTEDRFAAATIHKYAKWADGFEASATARCLDAVNESLAQQRAAHMERANG